MEQYSKKYKREATRRSDPLVSQLTRYPWPGNVRELQHAVERAVILSQTNVLQPEHVFKKDNKAFSQEDKTVFNLEKTERELIRKALREFNGSINEPARTLGLSRQA